MSALTEDRDAIVAALNSVEGISASSATPAPIVAGSAWPVWQNLEWSTRGTTLNRWQVFAALPNPNQQGTTDRGDELLHQLADALWPLGKVTIVEPMQWTVEPGQQAVPVLRFGLEI
jgi:hypothetical protein